MLQVVEKGIFCFMPVITPQKLVKIIIIVTCSASATISWGLFYTTVSLSWTSNLVLQQEVLSQLSTFYTLTKTFSVCCVMYQFRVLGKKIAFQLRFLLRQSPYFCSFFFFARDLEEFLSPIFHHALNVGLPSFMFLRWCMQYTEREHPKQVL